MNSLVKFQIKSIGFNFYIPIIIALSLMIYLLGFYNSKFDAQFFLVLQIIFVPSISLWSSLLVYSLYHENSEEIMIQLPSQKIAKYNAYFISLFSLLIIILVTIFCIKSESFSFISLFLLLFTQSLILSITSFLSSILFKSVEVSLLIVIMYCGSEGLTGGKLIPWPHIFYFDTQFTIKIIIINLFVTLIYLSICTWISIKYLRTIERRIPFI